MPTRFTSTLPGFDANGAATTISGYYQFGRLAYQTTGSGTLLASYTYDVMGVPVSVQVGTDPSSVPRYYYVYDARGDVANLTDVSGNVVASYAYDPWGNLTSASERIPNANGWTNPYRFDGRDRVRADATTELDWMTTRAYDPATGRFISRDPLGRAPLFFSDNPYVYAGNNPLSNIDPSGQYRAAGYGAAAHQTDPNTNQLMARVQAVRGCDAACEAQQRQEWDRYHVGLAKGIANEAANYFWGQAGAGLQPGAWKLAALKPTSTVPALLQLLGYGLSSLLLGGKSGLLATVSSGVLGFFNVLLGVEVMALVSYDVIALATYAFFNDIQASWTNAGWLDPATLSDSWIGYSLFFGLIAGALEIVSALDAITNPEVAPLVIGLQIGMAVAAFRILPRVKSYIDQEEQALGYAQS